MDIEKLIEQLNNLEYVAYGYNINGEVLGMECTEFECLMVDAATALSTLQSENEKLRTEVKMWKCRCKEIVSHASELDMDLQNAEKENAELLAELKQVINQRDNYHMYHYELALKPNCNTCADKDCKYRPIPGDTVRANCPLWRGPQKED